MLSFIIQGRCWPWQQSGKEQLPQRGNILTQLVRPGFFKLAARAVSIEYAHAVHTYGMRPQDVIFSVAHHQALRHIRNTAQAAGMPQHGRFAVARAGQLRARHMVKQAGNAKMLQNTLGKGFRL